MSPPRHARTLFVALALALLLAGGAIAASRQPQLALRSLQPLRVHGSHFAGGDRIRVTVRTETARRTRHVRANTRGGFTTTFRSVSPGRCGAFTVRATGRSGLRATLRRPPLPACMVQ